MMSEVNNIKTTNQARIETVNKVDAQESRQGKLASQYADHSAAKDTVSLTDMAAQLQMIQKKLVNSPNVDSARVKAIQAAIADGSYRVDGAEIAKNMIKLEKDLA